MGTIDTIKPLSTVLNLSNTKRKILGKSDNWTRGYWYWVRSKNATSVLCSPPRRSIFDTGQWLGSGNLPKKSAELYSEPRLVSGMHLCCKKIFSPSKVSKVWALLSLCLDSQICIATSGSPWTTSSLGSCGPPPSTSSPRPTRAESITCKLPRWVEKELLPLLQNNPVHS